MRYYGMTNQSGNMSHQTPMGAKDEYMEAKPASMPQIQKEEAADYPSNLRNATENQNMEAIPQAVSNDEDKTFNRSNPNSGIYRGQRAQNVRPVNEWLENLPPAVMPPGSNPSAMGFENATVYEYPAPMQHSEMHNIMEKACPTQMSQISFLCAHRGKAVKVEMGNGLTKSGILRNINKNYIVLEEKGSGNHIMCNMNAVKSIDIFMY